MIRTKNLTANNSPVELGFTDQVESPYTLIITNLSANKHLLVGVAGMSLTNYGVRVEHDSPPLVIENIAHNDKLYAISEDPLQNIPVSIMVIERA